MVLIKMITFLKPITPLFRPQDSQTEPESSDLALRGVGSMSRRPKGPGFSGQNKASIETLEMMNSNILNEGLPRTNKWYRASPDFYRFKRNVFL
jgi:hypothetical protein